MLPEKFDPKSTPFMKKPIEFEGRKTKASIEAIINVKKGKDKFIAKGNFTFYDDRTNEILQSWPLVGVGKLRNYVRHINNIKEGDEEAVDDLIRSIQGFYEKKHEKLSSQKENYVVKNYLINELKQGELPEQEIHHYFSLWDKK